MTVIRFPDRKAKEGGSAPQGQTAGAARLVPLHGMRRKMVPADDAGKSTGAAGILPLVLDDVYYVVSKVALIRGVSFRLPPGRRTVVLGYNGAGKSLLLRLCHGLISPTSGSIRWEGALGGMQEAVARAQAMVFQRPVLLRRSVRENLLFVLRNRGIRGERAEDMVRQALAMCGIARLAERPARALSGGEQQKLALARAWLLRPEVLFLDEPTASLDPAATLELEGLMLDMHRAGATMVFSTHDMAQARRLAEHVLFLHNGLLLEDAPAEDFFRRPATPEARAFLAGDLMP